MAFWDDLSKKASETTAKAVQQAKDLSGTAKLNVQIAEEEKKLNGFYCQLGKLYAMAHPEDYEENFASVMSLIIESEQKIKECRTQIHDIKGVVRCEKCGADVPKGAAFCTVCGSPVAVPDLPTTGQPEAAEGAPEKQFCPGCGNVISKGARFCTSCGRALENP
ncbi:MAG: zinc ribbon domain-containing protein [Lachnospiraceae bacterium]|nr:zinc ribbon domain-containing protein [Lachnospiraceae bacterium]